MTERYAQVLRKWLKPRLTTDQLQWLETTLAKVADTNSERDFHLAFGLIPRKLNRTDLALDTSELSEATEARTNWDPSCWTLDTAARQLLLCEVSSRSPAKFGELFADQCKTADLSESIALYNGIPLYPISEKLDVQIGEGLRTNMRAVFEAIAHRNPYPAENFDQNRWNHLVLKALFIDSKLGPIQGLEQRANPELASILCDYAHERWAADRPVSPELWRCVGPFAQAGMLEDLNRVAMSSNEEDKKAAALALSVCNEPAAKDILNSLPEYRDLVASGKLQWDSVAIGDNR